MHKYFKRLILIFLTAGIFFGLLVGGQYLFKNYYVADRFQEKLTQIDGVTKVEINGDIINITLSKEGELKQVYHEISQIINDQNYQIKINDDSSKKLEIISERCEIALEEGIFRGNFTEMANYIYNLTNNQGVISQVFVDKDRVYLKLEVGDKYLYRIIDRHQNMMTE